MITKTTTITIYTANDGATFTSEEKCRYYEAEQALSPLFNVFNIKVYNYGGNPIAPYELISASLMDEDDFRDFYFYNVQFIYIPAIENKSFEQLEKLFDLLISPENNRGIASPIRAYPKDDTIQMLQLKSKGWLLEAQGYDDEDDYAYGIECWLDAMQQERRYHRLVERYMK